MSQIGIYFDQTRCIGCYTCVIACKDWHNIQNEQVNWINIKKVEKGKFPNVFLAFFIELCYHCAKPICVPACPNKAINKIQSKGIVVVNQDKCLGKSKCEERCKKACLWQIPQFDLADNAKMQKCDLCLDRLENGQKPICIDACPVQAIDIAPLNDLYNQYGQNIQMEGFTYSQKTRPSLTCKRKY